MTFEPDSAPRAGFARNLPEESQAEAYVVAGGPPHSSAVTDDSSRRLGELNLHSIPEALKFRRTRLVAYRRMLQESGITAEQANTLADLLELGRPTDHFLKPLPAGVRLKLSAVLALPGGAPAEFDRWERIPMQDPEELLDMLTPAELARVIVRELGRLQKPPPLAHSDRFLYPAIALLQLREIGGTWEHVAEALREKLRAMNAGADVADLNIAYGKNIRAFAAWHGADLPAVAGHVIPGDIPLSGENLQLLAMHTLMGKAETHRASWSTSDANARFRITADIDETVRNLAGSGRTKIPLSVAIKEYVSGKSTRETLERSIATHRPTLAPPAAHDRHNSRASAPIIR